MASTIKSIIDGTRDGLDDYESMFLFQQEMITSYYKMFNITEELIDSIIKKRTNPHWMDKPIKDSILAINDDYFFDSEQSMRRAIDRIILEVEITVMTWVKTGTYNISSTGEEEIYDDICYLINNGIMKELRYDMDIYGMHEKRNNWDICWCYYFYCYFFVFILRVLWKQ